MNSTQVLTPILTHLDRCDRCGAQAYVKVFLASGDLLFCAHHGHQYELKLREIALDIHDETAKLRVVSTPVPAESG
jgi:hypothetical protein